MASEEACRSQDFPEHSFSYSGGAAPEPGDSPWLCGSAGADILVRYSFEPSEEPGKYFTYAR
jgi:hypothetical protein